MDSKIIKYIFFLGGQDAEMCEIRKILEHHRLTFYDKKLHWGARASAYREELLKIDKKIPILIELKVDIPLPDHAIIIDHHGPQAGKDQPTSIEQVAELLGLSLNRWQKLIAANDRGWIDGLKAFGASETEIEQVRRYDRQCQGVTEAEETLAAQAIQEMEVINGIAVVRIPFRHISSVTDRLYGKYDDILVITPESINFSGDGKRVLKLAATFPEGWYGGNLPEKGFWGVEGKKRINEIIKILME